MLAFAQAGDGAGVDHADEVAPRQKDRRASIVESTESEYLAICRTRRLEVVTPERAIN